MVDESRHKSQKLQPPWGFSFYYCLINPLAGVNPVLDPVLEVQVWYDLNWGGFLLTPVTVSISFPRVRKGYFRTLHPKPYIDKPHHKKCWHRHQGLNIRLKEKSVLSHKTALPQLVLLKNEGVSFVICAPCTYNNTGNIISACWVRLFLLFLKLFVYECYIMGLHH